jgi:inorganic pyrophosphatase
MENYRQWLGKKVKVIMDRPLGSRHPDFPNCIYAVNYGFLLGTNSDVDNEAIDAYVLGPDVPLKEFGGIVIAIVVRQDSEIKLIVSDGRSLTSQEIEKAIDFQEQYHHHRLILA